MHTRIEPTRYFRSLTGLTPSQRIAQIKAQLATERQVARSAGDQFDRDRASRNVKDLEVMLERAETNERLHAERVQQLDADRAAKTEARAKEKQARIEADLRARYDRTMPLPTTDEQWDAVKDSVMHKHRLAQMSDRDGQVKQAAGRYRI